MIYGIISDIHSNLEALEACLERLGHVDRYLTQGDIVGYGPQSAECLARLRELDCIAVQGNHDAAVSGTMDTGWFNPSARVAVNINHALISDTDKSWLAALPLVAYIDDFALVHGSLASPEMFPYVSSFDSARRCFENMDNCTLCFIGHSHFSEVYIQKIGEMEVDCRSLARGGKLDLAPGFKYILNSGSVGQPRDGNKLAACARYDSEVRTIEVLRVEYDVVSVQSKMRYVELPDFLIRRLEYGE